MSGEKTTSQQSQTATATPQEQALMQQQIDMNNFMNPYAKSTYANLSNNINAILTGQTPQAQGIGGVSDAQNQSMVNQSVRSVLPQFQSAGILDSGIAAQGAIRAAQDTSNQNAQFNVSAAQNLFNLASGGQSNLSSQYQNNTNNLTSQLAGLRTTNSSGSTIGMNPFLKSFESSTGQAMGNNFNGPAWLQAAKPGCWVAAEIFGDWNHPKTIAARNYVNFIGPKWFKEFYLKHGEKVANFISNKPALKLLLRPLFEMFALIGKESSYATTAA